MYYNCIKCKLEALSGAQREELYQAYDEGMSPFVIGCAILRTSQEQKASKLTRST